MGDEEITRSVKLGIQLFYDADDETIRAPKMPEYQTEGSACADIYSGSPTPLIIEPRESVAVPTGIRLEIPEGYEVQIRARSGLAAKHCVWLTNGVGTIDSDYRGELKILLYNGGKMPYKVKMHDRIAQMLIAPVTIMDLEERADFSNTARGEGGFGSTG